MTHDDPPPPRVPTDAALPIRADRAGLGSDATDLTPRDLIVAGTGLARLTVGATVRLSRWGVRSSLAIGGRVLRAAVSGETATTLIDDATEALRDQARDLLGIVDGAGRIVGVHLPGEESELSPEVAAQTTRSLRAKGAALLDASADVHYEQTVHPAYPRILDELAPDEARILRLIALEGPQPAVDVRTSSPLPGGSQLVAAGLTMIGAEAGIRHVDRVEVYLRNLERLGLLWFSREPLEDPLAYQVLEAQPEVLEAMGRGRTKTVRRSIQMTAFGLGFAQTCLPLD